MAFKTGDIVSYINEDLEGEVLSVSGDSVIILDQDGFEREASSSEIIKKKDFLQNSQSIVLKPDDQKKTHREKKAKRNEPEVVDLHFHEIYHTDRGLSNFEKLSMQLEYALNKIENAQSQRKKSIVFIHGKGAGVLKTELRSMVKKLEDCFYEDADWRKFGEGATTVYWH